MLNQKTIPWVLAIISLLSMFTSLFWSFILHWIPCEFCWYERICMYPLALIFTLLLFGQKTSPIVTLVLSASGFLLSLYHYLLQMVPYLSTSTSCSSVVSCATPDFDVFGFITPPLLALIAFCALFTFDVFRLYQMRSKSS